VRTQTDNKSFANKVFLRRQATQHLPELRVLDLFAGQNVLWQNIPSARYYGVEILPEKGANLNADAHQAIESLDLAAFNVIDCDTYGIPFALCRKLLQNPAVQPGTVILYTAICSVYTRVPNDCLALFGLQDLYPHAPGLFNRHAVSFFFDMLGKLGVCEHRYYTTHDSYKKHYGYFIKP